MIHRACTTCGAISDQTKCPTHRKDPRPSAAKRGYGAKWRETRAAYLNAHPYCQHTAGCIAEATDVHHLDGLGPNGPRGHDWTNLTGLCHAHHSEITATAQPGGWHRPV